MSIRTYILREILVRSMIKENAECRRLFSTNRIRSKYDRIYHYHVKKTGGTSINIILLSLSGKSGKQAYAEICERKIPRKIYADKVFVAWSKRLIEKGDYFYGFSHIPAHALKLPPRTFTIACFRDPLKRIVSHYKMIMEYKVHGIQHGRMWYESKWFKDSFEGFLRGIPKRHLLRQIYMFSKRYNIEEAFDKIAGCSHVMLTDSFNEGVKRLSLKLETKLEVVHERKTSVDITIDDNEIDMLRDILQPEYELISKIKNCGYA